jgi:hypothetical protein
MVVKFIDTPYLIAICVTFDPGTPDISDDGWMIKNRHMVFTHKPEVDMYIGVNSA